MLSDNKSIPTRPKYYVCISFLSAQAEKKLLSSFCCASFWFRSFFSGRVLLHTADAMLYICNYVVTLASHVSLCFGKKPTSMQTEKVMMLIHTTELILAELTEVNLFKKKEK